MKKDRKNTNIYLIGIGYKGSMNSFNEFYGDNISYSSIEQESYIDLKDMIFSNINENIKFRKYERDGMTLILKVEMTIDEKEKFDYLLKNNEFVFYHNYEIRNIKILNNE
jgi:hypothetical protein